MLAEEAPPRPLGVDWGAFAAALPEGPLLGDFEGPVLGERAGPPEVTFDCGLPKVVGEGAPRTCRNLPGF